MEFAIVEGQRRAPFHGGRGLCQTCGSLLIAKCGPRVMHSWAHWGRRQCDPWWENETSWHRSWKGLFPEDCREVVHVAADDEIHRADIRTPTGIYVEVQHSAITDAERLSREQFYGNLVWVIDAAPFRKNFDIFHVLPHPDSALAADLIWYKSKREMQGAAGGIFLRLSECQAECPEVTKTSHRGGWVYGIDRISEQVHDAYVGHHQYDWIRPRRTWLDATCPVFIDFGRDMLGRLDLYDGYLPCIQLMGKRDFVQAVMTHDDVRQIGRRSAP